MYIAHKKGFTLIEMIVALGIFSIVAVVALGALVKIIDANKKAQTLQSAITNLNFALDTMSRELKEGVDYKCLSRPGGSFDPNALSHSSGCGNSLDKSYDMITFASSKMDSSAGACYGKRLWIAYYFDNSTPAEGYILKKAKQLSCTDVFSDTSFTRVVSSNVQITDYGFKVNRAVPFPIATVRIKGSAGSIDKEKTYFDVQTAVSTRFAQ